MHYTISRAAILERAEQAAKLVEPFVGNIYGIPITLNSHPRYLGTGFFLKHEADIFMLTAKHVVEKSRNYSYVMHSQGNGEVLFPLKNGWTGRERDHGDLALWECFAENFEEQNLEAMSFPKAFGNSMYSNNDMFLGLGFPDEMHTHIPATGEIYHARRAVLGTTMSLDPSFDPNIHFAFSCAEGDDYHGMSGSPVWNMNIQRGTKPSDWRADWLTFAGIVHTHIPKTNCIVATRADVVRSFLNGATERLRSQRP